MAIVFLVCFLAAGAWLLFGNISGYSYATAVNTNAALNPLAKDVVTNANHGWLNNYATYPITMAAPIAILGALLVIISAGKHKASQFHGH
jgi:cytochrome d ubiquinol oxidase subunit II